MARACVIVLDAVGVGDLPDADRFGTAGSNTLGHVADAVGGLELPALQQLGLGNVLPLAGCPPRAAAPAVWGRLAERSLGMTQHPQCQRPIGRLPNFPGEDDVSVAFWKGLLKYGLGLALFSLGLCVPAQAGELAAKDVAVAPSIVCDTQRDMERFVALYENEDDQENALNKVNAEVRNPPACMAGIVAFIRGPVVA
jgi:hypothetical protein